MLGVGDVAEVRVGPREDAETGLGGVFVQQFGGRAVGAGHDFVDVGEQVGEGQQAELLFKGHEVGDAAQSQGQGAFLDVAEALAFVAQRAAVEALHFHLAARLFFHILFESMADDTHFRIFRVTQSDFQRRFRRGGCGDGPQKQCRQYKGKHLLVAHECSPLSLVGL